MNIKPTYVTFSQAKLLKEKGFNIVTRSKYIKEKFIEGHFLHNYNSLSGNGGYEEYSILFACPEQWQVIEWLRVEHGIWIIVDILGKNSYYGEKNGKFIYSIYNKTGKQIECSWNNVGKNSSPKPLYFDSPQKAYSAAFDYVLTKLI